MYSIAQTEYKKNLKHILDMNYEKHVLKYIQEKQLSQKETQIYLEAWNKAKKNKEDKKEQEEEQQEEQQDYFESLQNFSYSSICSVCDAIEDEDSFATKKMLEAHMPTIRTLLFLGRLLPDSFISKEKEFTIPGIGSEAILKLKNIGIENPDALYQRYNDSCCTLGFSSNLIKDLKLRTIHSVICGYALSNHAHVETM